MNSSKLFSKQTFGLLFLSFILAACSSSNENQEPIEAIETIPLLLSAENWIHTDGIRFEFEILQGNGGYKVTCDGEDRGIATIEGNKVSVELLAQGGVVVTVTDCKQKEAVIVINSSSDELKSNVYTIYTGENTSTLMAPDFGRGGYSIERTEGTSVEAEITGDDKVRITCVGKGNSYFKIKDSRGVTATLTVLVASLYETSQEEMTVRAINDQHIGITLRWSDTEWEFAEKVDSELISDLHLVRLAVDGIYDFLQLNTAKKGKGEVTIKLKEKTSGDIVSVKLMVE